MARRASVRNCFSAEGDQMEPGIAWPTGTVTFLFTDMEKSTRHWEKQTEEMHRSHRRHDDLLRDAIRSHGGKVFKTVGDAFCSAFADASEAVAAAVEAQRSLRRELPDLRVRMALHTGEPEFRDEDYFGLDVNRAARLVMAAHGGQVLLSRATAQRVQGALTGEANLRSLGRHRLRDLPLSESIYQLQTPDLPSRFPPLNTLDVTFRQGLVRVLSISAVMLAVVLGLLGYSIHQKRRADSSALRMRMVTQYPFEVSTLQRILRHELPIESLRFSPDGRRVAITGGSGRMRLWDIQPAAPTSRPALSKRSPKQRGQSRHQRLDRRLWRKALRP
jgi:class 3 adenylate cyclase